MTADGVIQSFSSLESDITKPGKKEKHEVCDYFFCQCHRFMDVRWAVFCHSMAIFTQSMFISGFVTGSITTIEHRFDLSSREVGVISVMYDLGQLLLLLPVSHLGSTQWRKMRIVSAGLLLMGMAALLYATPHFLSGRRRAGAELAKPICNASSVPPAFCAERADVQELRRLRWVFWVAAFLFGTGVSPLFSLGTAYINENSPQNKGYFYFALLNCNIFLGAAMGNILIGAFLSIDINIGSTENIKASQMQQLAHLGAWWLGPLVTMTASFFVLVPLFGFPKHMPDYYVFHQQRLDREKKNGTQPQHTFAESMRLIMTNVILLLVCISLACELLFFTGLTYFGPKYMEQTFSVSRSKAPTIIGGSTVAAGASGVLIAGWITRKGNFGLRGNLVMLASVSLVNLLPVSAFLIGCAELRVHSQQTTCNADCHCLRRDGFSLIGCGADSRNYLSPCYAGCRTANSSGFFDCSCIRERPSERPEWTTGYCSTSCGHLMPLFVFVMCIEVFGVCMLSSPGINAVLRSVDERLQTIALGLAGMFSRLFGSLPGPLIFAYLIDKSCITWNQTCDTRGFCKDYHRQLLRQNFLTVTLVCKCVSSAALCTALLIHIHRSPLWPLKAQATSSRS